MWKEYRNPFYCNFRATGGSPKKFKEKITILVSIKGAIKSQWNGAFSAPGGVSLGVSDWKEVIFFSDGGDFTN